MRKPSTIRRFPGLLRRLLRVGIALACASPSIASQSVSIASVRTARRAAGGGDFECALSLYADVLARRPDDRDALKGRAQVLLWTTRYAEAEQDYRRVLRADPVDVEARTGLARALLRENRFEESERGLREILSVVPNELEARLLLGEVLLRTDRTPEARAEYERATATEPGDARGRLGSARALAASGRLEEARDLDAETADGLAHRLLEHADDTQARLELATALERLDRLDEALAQYDAVLRRKPESLEAELGRARVLLRLSRLADADAGIHGVLLAHPESAAAHGLQGDLLLRSARPAEAALAFEAASDLDPWSTEYRIGLANSRAALSDVGAARAAGAEALALDPWSHDVRELLSRLDAIEVPSRFRLDAGARFDDLTGPADDWWQETFHLAWKARPELTLGLGVDGFQRFDQDDVQYTGDVAWRANEDWTLSGAYTYGPDAVVVAKSAVDAEVARRVGASSSAILHYRHAAYVADVRTDILSPGFEFPCGAEERLLLRYYYVHDSDTGDGHAGSVRLELWPEGPLRTRVGIAYGSEAFLADSVTQAVRTSEVLTLFAGVEWRCAKRTRLSLGYDFEDHRDSADKQGVAFGVTLEF